MEKLVFVEKDVLPTDQILIKALQKSYVYYSDVLEQLSNMIPEIRTEWKYYGKKNGWLLKHLDKKRNVFFLVAYEGVFKLSFTFGDKAISEIIASDTINSYVKELVQSSKKYAEGTSFLFAIDSETKVKQAIELIKIKLS